MTTFLYPDVLRHFEEEVHRNFNFLVVEHSFTGPLLDVTYPLAKMTYARVNLALIFLWDERDEDIGCRVARVIDGVIQPAWPDDPSMYSSLYTVVKVRLDRRKTSAQLLNRIGGLPLREQITVTLRDYAAMLRTYAQDILADSPTALSSW